jgi:hypothetical protein
MASDTDQQFAVQHPEPADVGGWSIKDGGTEPPRKASPGQLEGSRPARLKAIRTARYGCCPIRALGLIGSLSLTGGTADRTIPKERDMTATLLPRPFIDPNAVETASANDIQARFYGTGRDAQARFYGTGRDAQARFYGTGRDAQARLWLSELDDCAALLDLDREMEPVARWYSMD